MKIFIKIAFVSCLAVIGISPGYAQIRSIEGSPYEKEAVPRKQMISKGEAITVVKRELDGKVLSATLIDSQGPPVYRVKMLLSKGRVRTVFVDATNGRVVRIR